MKKLCGDPLPNNPEPEPAKMMRCPSWMPAHGMKLWRKLVPKLIQLNIVTELDRPSLEAMCLAYHLMRQAGEEIACDGLTVKAERGDTVKKHPSFSVFKTNSDIYRKFAEMFGLSPMSRQRLDIKMPEPHDEREDLLT